MKRSPLKRNTPLRATKPIARSITPMKRTAIKAKPPRVATTIPKSERRKAEERSGGMCEARVAMACHGKGEQMHHRKRRWYGDHRAVNLLHVCDPCHKAIHNPTSVGLPVSWSYDHGFLVRSTDDPAAVVVSRT